MRSLGVAAAFLLLPVVTSSSQIVNTGGGRPSVAPDGKTITYSAARNGAWDVYVVRADGSDARRVTNVGDRTFVNLGPPTWIGDRVLVWQRVSDTTRAWLVGTPDPGRIVVPPDALQIRPSPDGRRLVFLHGSRNKPRVALSNLDGTGLHDVTDSTQVGINPDWSPDGKRVVFTLVDSARHGQIAIVDADGGTVRVLTHMDPAEGLPQWPNWSRDGKWIVIQAGIYNRQKFEESIAHLWVVDARTGAATKLNPHTNYSLDETPSWFPDGRHIAFQSNRSGVMQVWVMNADGTGARQVTKLDQ